ncbi:Carbohydrate-binding X8 domain superfamily protein [Trifolium repens]|nr:Carbohydrate-binding X8 domain superfamily protein [Trifolium repens]
MVHEFVGYGSCNYKPSPAVPSPPGRNFDDEYKLFCVPKPGASEQELIANIEYACSQLGNCTTISTNGDCFLPNTTLNHASVAMNMYYASQDRVYEACNFSNSGLITITDPSYDSCIFV